MGQINKLSDRKVQSIKLPGMYADGGGLYLQVTAGKTCIAKSWIFRYATPSGDRYMGLGSLNTIGLAKAREKARQARELRLEGKDPLTEKRALMASRLAEQAKAMTFDECRDRYIAAHQAGWRNNKHAAQWAQALSYHVSPALGSLPVQAIDTAVVLRTIEPLWTKRPETASRLRGRIERILDWAAARGLRKGQNPARWKGHLDKLLPARSKVHRIEHLAALPYVEIGAFMANLRQRDTVNAKALEFAILTAVRSGEVLGAKWNEIKDRVWTVPASRTKAHKEHRVPLSNTALAVLQRMPKNSEFVFSGRDGKQLGHNALLQVLHAMGRSEITVHGFRSTFRDWAAEQTGFPNHVVEQALAHAIGDRVEAAYRRGDLFEKRRRLMDAWATYCKNSTTPVGEVVALHSVG